MMRKTAAFFFMVVPVALSAQQPRALLPIDFVNSAEYAALQKPVLARRTFDDMSAPSTWRFSGTGKLSFPAPPADGIRALRVDMNMYVDTVAPTRSRLSQVNLARPIPGGEDWSAYNRISMWIKPDFAGIPAFPIQIVLHNDGKEKIPDKYDRDGTHYVTLSSGSWQQVTWEIDQLPRDKVTLLEFGYWVNRMYAARGDHVSFEIGDIELQRVVPDHHTGWDVAPGKIAFSHSGYTLDAPKTAIANGIPATTFDLIRVSNNALGEVVLHKPVKMVKSRLQSGSAGADPSLPPGTTDFQELDFSEVTAPGDYQLRLGNITTRTFHIGNDAWKSSIWKALNFFYGNRCGFAVPGVHGIDHLDWFATKGDQRVVMSGGWHDAGDLSQGVINTGEATYAMFELADKLRTQGDDPALLARVLEEAKWGLDWVMRVRLPGGYRMGFTNHNLWTDNIVGDLDDRTREMKNNPNANYIAAAAEAIAARVLRETEPALAAKALAIAEDDWSYAITGVDGPETWHTPAFAASQMELAGIGATASVELYRTTGNMKYAGKAFELARVVSNSQQKTRVGTSFPLSGFFYTGTGRDTIFHQFHRAADQAGVVALSQLIETFPDHPDWILWYSTVVDYAEYQKKTAATTAPYGVLPAYVYRLADARFIPDSGALYGATRDAYIDQVKSGMPMGGDWYLRNFPVWYARRGNYGVLLSQAKAASAVARLRGDTAGLHLAERQAEWVVGRNPFAQSTMYGEGYDWAQQYSVSSGDLVGSLPVGMQSKGVLDVPFWPQSNMYVYKEVWVHSTSRWLWLMADLLPAPAPADPPFTLTSSVSKDEVTIRLTTSAAGAHTYALRTENLGMRGPITRTVTVEAGKPSVIEWKGKIIVADAPWLGVVIPDGNVERRREVPGSQ